MPPSYSRGRSSRFDSEHLRQRQADSMHSLGHADNRQLTDPPDSVMANCGHRIYAEDGSSVIPRGVSVRDSYGAEIGKLCRRCAEALYGTAELLAATPSTTIIVGDFGYYETAVALDVGDINERIKHPLGEEIDDTHHNELNEYGVERANLL